MSLWEIKLPRGKKENLPSLSLGELAYITDESELYIGGLNGENINITNNASLNEKANKNNSEFTGTMTLNGKDIAVYSESDIELLNGWNKTSESAICKVAKSGNIKSLNMCISNGSTTAGTIITHIGEYAPIGTLAFPIFGVVNNTTVWVNVQSDGNVVIGGGDWSSIGTAWLNINCCYI